MGNDAKRTPGKWWVERGHGMSSIHAPDTGDQPFDDLIAFTYHERAQANAAFIVQACNSHDALVAALADADAMLQLLTIMAYKEPLPDFLTHYIAMPGRDERVLLGDAMQMWAQTRKGEKAIALATEANDDDPPEHLEREGAATMGGDRFPRGQR